VRPAADSRGTKQETGNEVGWLGICVGGEFGAWKILEPALQDSNDVFTYVQLLLHAGSVCLVVCLLASAHLADRNCAVD